MNGCCDYFYKIPITYCHSHYPIVNYIEHIILIHSYYTYMYIYIYILIITYMYSILIHVFSLILIT